MGTRRFDQMSQKKSVRAALAVLMSVLAFAGCAETKPPERIILIVVDTLRRDVLRCYGGPIRTPAIDALAARGQIFPNAVSSFHQTTMSMAAMYTGRTPSVESGRENAALRMTGRTWCGMARFRDNPRDGCIPSSLVTLGELVHGAGYWTIGIVSNLYIFKPFGMEQGFDEWLEIGERVREARSSRSAEVVNAAAIQALARRPHDRFYLYVHYMDVHDYTWGKYDDGVVTMDRAVGALLEKLEAEHLLEDAVVLFTSDHGERLGERHFVRGEDSHRGNPSFEEVLQVPLIVSPPLFDDASRLVRSQDIYQLIAQVVGVRAEVPQDLEPSELFLSEERWQTYRKGTWKSYMRRANGELQLVDLLADPAESRDIAPENGSVAETHRARIAELAHVLGAPDAHSGELTDEDKMRLRALGYLD